MRTTDWGGNPPDDETEARQVLLEAALTCVKKYGLDKVNIKRVAEEVGVTRQTVYRYFPSTEALVTAVSFSVGGDVLDGLQQHIGHYSGFEQKVLESVFYLTRKIPNDPFLSQYFSAQSSDSSNVRQVFEAPPLEYSFRAIKSMYSENKVSASEEKWLRSLAEHALRLVLALIMAPSQHTRTDKALRQYLELWLKPALAPPR
ncbi:MAG TPA: TetR/AcrR family transcriptional regulator [Dongiaceae bacterium]|nr:TetR/AcrR family transcriptional regulator [Dongiaceae bacterium]